MPSSPHFSFRIWFTERSGSTMLCRALQETGLAGKPGEYFNLFPHDSLTKKHGVSSYEELKAHLWQQGTTDNGVFGIKHSYGITDYNKLFAEICALQDINSQEVVDHEVVWEDIFPRVRHIYLTRRNKIRQVVSWWKAINTQQWHISPDEEGIALDDAFFEKNYDFAALRHLLTETTFKEAASEAYFQRHNIKPHTIVYEDLCRDYQGEVNRLLQYLGIDFRAQENEHTFYRRTSDERSEIWLKRFRDDIQEAWPRQMW